MREKRQIRAVSTDFQTREENDTPHITGYFAVFNSTYEIGSGMTESIAPGAFQNTLSADIRALVNHDSTLVLGRTKAHTLELKEDERGLWGDITINPEDRDAMNLYERVRRGDVDQCSFGFNIVREETEVKENGDIHWRIQEVELFEVSACTFPAYEQTNISARTAQRDHIRARQLDAWRTKWKGVLKNGTESPDAQEED
jgi:HK97 family phage prohead protease